MINPNLSGSWCWRRPLAVLSAWLAVGMLVLASCGGVESGGTGTFASGPITGFGSVIVNDIVFDDTAAAVEDVDGAPRASTDLRLGMTVEVDGDALQGSQSRAARIRYASAIVGPVQSVDAAGFVVLGQRVAVDATTVFDNALAGGLAALSALPPGQVVEVYGLLDGAAGYRATRVELRSAVLGYRLLGQVDAVPGSHTLRIGTALFAYDSAANAPAVLAVGQLVRLFISVDRDSLGRYVVLRFGLTQRGNDDREGASLKGLITQFTSLADFRVDDRPVDARAAQISGGTLALGARVEVSGAMVSGVLRATRVDVRSDDEEHDRGFELRGAIESVNIAQRSFVLRGLTIGTSRSDLQVVNGTLSDLANWTGRRVDVTAQLAGNGTGLEATRITFGN